MRGRRSRLLPIVCFVYLYDLAVYTENHFGCRRMGVQALYGHADRIRSKWI
jgi:hypothetical protein